MPRNYAFPLKLVERHQWVKMSRKQKIDHLDRLFLACIESLQLSLAVDRTFGRDSHQVLKTFGAADRLHDADASRTLRRHIAARLAPIEEQN
jgi:hypothetical protein